MSFIVRHSISIGVLLMVISTLASKHETISDLLAMLAVMAFVINLIGCVVIGRRKLNKAKEFKARATAKADVTRR
ncbi:hypothetical protein L1D46_05410 [Pseudoalteromonas sp. Isolate3]|jgi:predicted membrane protein|uniref:hypothetical protein n=1 Tax=Pseudoalteromonas TaxID=53246 RepID=UPI001C3D18E0|nr:MULTISPECIES: hypothetical protein [Pseudoalteromonas]MCG9708238.1 hypothetical protein [Pseudoalteromonas sp. Isolate3]